MSGGVDSSVAAALLKQDGYDVVGVTFRLWTAEDDHAEKQGSCCSLNDINDARLICNQLDIPHYVLNFKDVFKKEVIANFVEEYQKGRTPNPCIECNRKIKFEHFYQKARGMGFDYIATGHYVRNEWNEQKQRFELKTATYLQKDQSYFLYNIPYGHLAHTLFPLGQYTKPQVRALAEQFGFRIAKKKDSQEICFVDNRGYGSFLQEYTGITPPTGDFIDINGQVLGMHKGIWNYTIGQRKGLGISYSKPLYVKSINIQDNTVTLAEDKDNYAQELTAEQVHYILPDPITEPKKIVTKIRNRAPFAEAELIPINATTAKVVFEEPQRAITKGQSAVFYEGDVVLGGGIIV